LLVVWRRDPRGRGYGKISKNLWDSNQFEGLGFPRHELGAMHRKKEVSASWPDGGASGGVKRGRGGDARLSLDSG
jgi:hypothetical protein